MPSVALSSPSPSSAASKAPASPIVPIIVAAVAALLLVSAMLLTFHFRRQNKKKMDTARAARKGREVQAGETVLRTHPATLMVLPPHGEGNPRFVHTPGTNMRIATRRADGAWEFADPRAPFTPAIIADASDAALPANRNSAVSTAESSSDPSHNSPYSYASYGDQTPGSSSQLLPPPTAASASPWGAPTTPLTADMDISARSPWRSAHSPTPSTSASTFLPAPSIATDSRRGSTVSSNDSFLDLDARSTHSNPFLSPASTAPSRGARWPASPAASARSSPEPPTTPAAARVRQTESPAARAIRLGYEEMDRNSAYAEQSGTASSASRSPEPPMTPAARAKEAESAAARAIRRGYESVDRSSEYAEPDEDLPSY